MSDEVAQRLRDALASYRLVTQFLGPGKVVIPTPGLGLRGVGKRMRRGRPEYYCILSDGGAMVYPDREGFRQSLHCVSVPPCRADDLIGKLDSVRLSAMLDLNPDNLTAAERRIYNGLGNDAKRLFNDLAWSLDRGSKYYGGLGSNEAKVELQKKRLVTVHWSQAADPTKDVVIFTTRGKRMAKRLFE